MNKTQFIDAVAAKSGLTKADAKKAVDAFIGVAAAALKSKDARVALIPFGTFSVTKRSARTGRNPRTGATIKIAAKKVVRFKAGSQLNETINK